MTKITTAALMTNLLILQVYTVQKGDTLSAIINERDVKPIYGKEGALEVLKKINNINDVNLIYPGQLILVPGDGAVLYEKENNSSEVTYSSKENESQIEDKIEIVNHSIEIDTGNFSVNSNNNGERLIVNGGTNQLTYKVESQKNSLVYSTLVSADYYILSPKISFPINVKKMILMNYELGISYKNEHFKIGSSIGYEDKIGFYSDLVQGLSIDKSMTPYFSVGSVYDFSHGVFLSGKTRHFLSSETNRFKIKSGDSYKLTVGKEIYKFRSGGSLSGILGYEKSSIKTSQTEDEDIKTTFGVKIDW